MATMTKKDLHERDVLIKQLEPVIAQQATPFDAYRLAKLTGQAPMSIGRALSELASRGLLKALGEGPDGHLGERYVPA